MDEDEWLVDIGDIIYDVNWADTITITDINWDAINIITTAPVEFEDCMPVFSKIKDMCKEYPGLEKAYENFKSVYRIVEPDWQERQLKKK